MSKKRERRASLPLQNISLTYHNLRGGSFALVPMHLPETVSGGNYLEPFDGRPPGP